MLTYWSATLLPGLLVETENSVYPLDAVRDLETDIAGLRMAGKHHGIQAMDTTDGCLLALYDLRLQQSTGFIYDFYFYQFPEHALIRSLRSRYLGELQQAHPDLIVVSGQDWPRAGRGFDRVNSWPELRDFLSSNYKPRVARHWYRIYVHN